MSASVTRQPAEEAKKAVDDLLVLGEKIGVVLETNERQAYVHPDNLNYQSVSPEFPFLGKPLLFGLF